MALENSIASEDSPSVDLQDISNALVSSSTKRRLAALSRIEKNLADRCKYSHVLVRSPRLIS